jgi:hypothetical protein
MLKVEKIVKKSELPEIVRLTQHRIAANSLHPAAGRVRDETRTENTHWRREQGPPVRTPLEPSKI